MHKKPRVAPSIFPFIYLSKGRRINPMNRLFSFIVVVFCISSVLFIPVYSQEQKKQEQQQPIDLNTELRNACADGNIARVNALIQQGANVNSQNPINKWTPLIHATDKSNNEIMEILIRNGAKPDIPEGDGWTALMFAAIRGNIPGCSILIRNGANIETNSKNGWNPLKAAKASKNTAVLPLLEKELAKANQPKVDNAAIGRDFLAAVKENKPDLVIELLNSGADPNSISVNGWTGLTYASASGNVAMMKLVLDKGTDINRADKDGWTPLMFAAFQVRKNSVSHCAEYPIG